MTGRICEARRAAQLSGAKTYASETCCKQGHLGLRRTDNATCVECHNNQRNARYDAARNRKSSRVALERELASGSCDV
jgi:hypothetical protein